MNFKCNNLISPKIDRTLLGPTLCRLNITSASIHFYIGIHLKFLAFGRIRNRGKTQPGNGSGQ